MHQAHRVSEFVHAGEVDDRVTPAARHPTRSATARAPRRPTGGRRRRTPSRHAVCHVVGNWGRAIEAPIHRLRQSSWIASWARRWRRTAARSPDTPRPFHFADLFADFIDAEPCTWSQCHWRRHCRPSGRQTGMRLANAVNVAATEANLREYRRRVGRSIHDEMASTGDLRGVPHASASMQYQCALFSSGRPEWLKAASGEN